ncbi:GYF domain-containing protein, partial [Haematococcus lacustris]
VYSVEFVEWALQQLKRWLPAPELSQVEVLLSFTSRIEVAELCEVMCGKQAGVSTFVAEFLKRKDEQLSRKGKTNKKGSAAAATPATPATAASIVSSGKAAKAGASPSIPGAEGWQQPAAAAGSSKKGGGQAGQKGQKATVKNGFAREGRVATVSEASRWLLYAASMRLLIGVRPRPGQRRIIVTLSESVRTSRWWSSTEVPKRRCESVSTRQETLQRNPLFDLVPCPALGPPFELDH